MLSFGTACTGYQGQPYLCQKVYCHAASFTVLQICVPERSFYHVKLATCHALHQLARSTDVIRQQLPECAHRIQCTMDFDLEPRFPCYPVPTLGVPSFLSSHVLLYWHGASVTRPHGPTQLHTPPLPLLSSYIRVIHAMITAFIRSWLSVAGAGDVAS